MQPCEQSYVGKFEATRSEVHIPEMQQEAICLWSN